MEIKRTLKEDFENYSKDNRITLNEDQNLADVSKEDIGVTKDPVYAQAVREIKKAKTLRDKYTKFRRDRDELDKKITLKEDYELDKDEEDFDLYTLMTTDENIEKYTNGRGTTSYRLTAPLRWYLMICYKAGLEPKWTGDFLYEVSTPEFDFDWVEEDVIFTPKTKKVTEELEDDKVKFKYAIIEFVEGGPDTDNYSQSILRRACRTRKRFADLDELGDLIYDADYNFDSKRLGYDKLYVDFYGNKNIIHHGVRFDLGDKLDRTQHLSNKDIPEIEDILEKAYKASKEINENFEKVNITTEDEVINIESTSITDNEDKEELNESYSDNKYFDYNKELGWTDEDIKLHKSINWKDRNYKDYEVVDDEFKSEIYVYGKEVEDKDKLYTFHKFIRSNAIYPPYYKAIDFKDSNVVGPMYDGRKHNTYKIHDRYETQELNDMLSESNSTMSESKKLTERKETTSDEQYSVGDTIRLIYMHDEPQYSGKDIVGKITFIDDIDQIHMENCKSGIQLDKDIIELVKKADKEDLKESFEDKITSETLRTPRGTFKIYSGTYDDFQKDEDFKEYGYWFSYNYPDDEYFGAEKLYKIMGDGESAIAVVYKDLSRDVLIKRAEKMFKEENPKLWDSLLDEEKYQLGLKLVDGPIRPYDEEKIWNIEKAFFNKDLKNESLKEGKESIIPQNATKLKLTDNKGKEIIVNKTPSGWLSEEPNQFGNKYLIATNFMRNFYDIEVLETTDKKPRTKRKEVRVLQGNYGGGYEDILYYDMPDDLTERDKVRKEINDDITAYRENEPQFSYRVITRYERTFNESLKKTEKDTLKESLDKSRGQWNQAEIAKRFGLYDGFKELEEELLKIKGVTNIDFDLDGLYDDLPVIIITDFDIPLETYFEERKRIAKEIREVVKSYGIKGADPMEFGEDYIYWAVWLSKSDTFDLNIKESLNEGLSDKEKKEIEELNKENGWGIDEDELITLINQHKKAREEKDKKTQEKIEYRLTDINFHSEVEMLKNGKYEEILKSVYEE